jgi:outer membrane protein OmpA-like peptidoglycan-associated protein
VASEALPATPPPAEGTVAIPTGAGVTTEARDGKPVVKVYFNTGKAEVVPAFGAAAGGLKAYLDSHAGSTLAVSGYNDKTGNAAKNAELSKPRAQAVKAALVASGIPDTSVALVKPAESTDKSIDNAGARRVEVVVQ